MTTNEWRDQQCKILEAAAKACELRKDDSPYNGGGEGNTGFDLLGNLVLDWDDAEVWNPLTNPADTAEMCAKLEITCLWVSREKRVTCSAFSKQVSNVKALYKDHDNSRLKAWMYAATMVAAKTQGYEE